MSNVQTLSFPAVIESTTCISCSVTFGVPAGFVDRRREDGRTYYCPNGHTMVFRETAATRLERELARAKRDLEWRDSQLASTRKELATTEARRRATKAVLTKTKKRLVDGRCPRCHTAFPDLKAHLAETHPEYGHEAHAEQRA